MICTAEILHFEDQSLCPEVGAIPESDGQVDMPDWYCVLPRHDAAERGTTWSDARSIDPHGVQGLGVHDVEATTPIYQHLCEPLRANNWVDYKRAPPWPRDVFRMIGAVIGDGRVRPLEERVRGQFGGADLVVCELLLAPRLAKPACR